MAAGTGSIALLNHIAVPSLAQIDDSEAWSVSESTDESRLVECPLYIESLIIRYPSVSVERRFEALLRILEQPLECPHILDTQENSISRLLDEAYEERLIELSEAPRRELLEVGEDLECTDEIIRPFHPWLPPSPQCQVRTPGEAASGAAAQVRRLKICRYETISRIWRRCS